MTGLVFTPADPIPSTRARQDVLRAVAGRPVEAFAPIGPNRYAVMVDGYVVAADGEELLVSIPTTEEDPAPCSP